MREIGAFAVADAASYRGNFPTFSQPKEVACFSRDASRAVKFDKSALRKYRPAQLPVPLDEEFEAYTPKAAGDEPAPLGDVLGALKHANAPPRPGTIITFRNNLNKLFLTPYQPRDDWEIGVAPLADGSIELHVRDTARKAAEEASRDERGRRMCYWGYRFEQLSTLSADEASALARARQAQGGGGGGYRVPSPSDQGSYEHLMTAEEAEAVHERSGPAGPTGAASNGAAPTVAAAVGAVDANVEFCSVVSVTIAKVRLLMAAEVDCVAGSGGGLKPGYVELKTSKVIRSAREMETFERHKLLKFWLQSFLAGVPTIIVGFRDDDGVVRELKALETMALPRMVRQKGYWDPTAAINFGKAVLEWLQEQAKLLPAGSKAILRYDPERKAVLLLADDADGGADGAAADGPPDAKRRRV